MTAKLIPYPQSHLHARGNCGYVTHGSSGSSVNLITVGSQIYNIFGDNGPFRKMGLCVDGPSAADRLANGMILCSMNEWSSRRKSHLILYTTDGKTVPKSECKEDGFVSWIRQGMGVSEGTMRLFDVGRSQIETVSRISLTSQEYSDFNGIAMTDKVSLITLNNNYYITDMRTSRIELAMRGEWTIDPGIPALVAGCRFFFPSWTFSVSVEISPVQGMPEVRNISCSDVISAFAWHPAQGPLVAVCDAPENSNVLNIFDPRRHSKVEIALNHLIIPRFAPTFVGGMPTITVVSGIDGQAGMMVI